MKVKGDAGNKFPWRAGNEILKKLCGHSFQNYMSSRKHGKIFITENP
jgi:hypothetical protein